MKVKVLYFARLREQMGQGTHLELKQGATVSDAIGSLIENDPNATQLNLPHILCACNHLQVSREYALNEGDELAFFPPVTGG